MGIVWTLEISYWVWAPACLAQGCLQQWSWKWCLGRAVEPGCILQSARAPQHAQLGKSQGHIPVCLWTCCPGKIPLWHGWHSASTASCVSKVHEFTVAVQRNILLQLSHGLHDFVKLNQAPPQSSPLQIRVPASFICPPEAAAPSSWPFTCLFLSFPLFYYPHLEMQD